MKKMGVGVGDALWIVLTQYRPAGFQLIDRPDVGLIDQWSLTAIVTCSGALETVQIGQLGRYDRSTGRSQLMTMRHASHDVRYATATWLTASASPAQKNNKK